MQIDQIQLYFKSLNYLVLNQMYFKKNVDLDSLSIDYLKQYNPGHLGSSMSINFVLANLYYFLNKKQLTSRLVIGTGHSGVSLISHLWLNGTLEKYNDKYERNQKGLNNLIKSFGSEIRSEINPEYPETIYDGGELGYSLGVAYGYAINSDESIIPCIIGDGEAETGTICAAWQLSKIINTKSKVLPIINLNGLKMGSESFLSKMSDNDLNNYFNSLGYKVEIIDSRHKSIEDTIVQIQESLNKCLNYKNPLIIFKSFKGFTLPPVDGIRLEGDISSHKNPLYQCSLSEKLNILKKLLLNYHTNFFDADGKILTQFDNFGNMTIDHPITLINSDYVERFSNTLDDYVYNLLKKNHGIVFSPDEIYSNNFKQCGDIAIEILNEQLLQALYQGYIQSGNFGCFISYEGFMPIVSSMISQYYKYLKQKQKCKIQKPKHSMNYILTSTCFENTYSHQNPDFVNTLFEKDDEFYNVYYPKDVRCSIKCFDQMSKTTDKINVIVKSKRHFAIYDSDNIDIEVVAHSDNPQLILCATGDYMLDQVLKIYDFLINEGYKVKVLYISKPQILNKQNRDALSDDEFMNYFNCNVPVIYLYSGYSYTINALISNRHIDCTVIGYSDGISSFGNLNNNIIANNLSFDDIISLCNMKITNSKKLIKRRIDNE